MSTIRVRDKEFEEYLSEEQIRERVKTLAAQINQEYAGKKPLLLPVLNGAFMFAADLARHLTVHPELNFIRVSTYGDGMTSSRVIGEFLGKDVDVEGKDVIIIEDIVDSGFTCQFLMDYYQSQNPASVKLMCLLFKPDSFEGRHMPDYFGFEIPSRFVIGYGLDYAQEGRELPAIYKLKE